MLAKASCESRETTVERLRGVEEPSCCEEVAAAWLDEALEISHGGVGSPAARYCSRLEAVAGLRPAVGKVRLCRSAVGAPSALPRGDGVGLAWRERDLAPLSSSCSAGGPRELYHLMAACGCLANHRHSAEGPVPWLLVVESGTYHRSPLLVGGGAISSSSRCCLCRAANCELARWTADARDGMVAGVVE